MTHHKHDFSVEEHNIGYHFVNTQRSATLRGLHNMASSKRSLIETT